MRRNLFRKTGVLAITLGLLECILYLFNHFFIDNYSSIGFREWASSLGFSVLLTFSGFLLLRDNEVGISLIKAYFWGSLLDRVLIFILYFNRIHIFTILMPLVLALPFGLILYFPKNVPHFRHKSSLSEKIVLYAIILALVCIPKAI